MEHEVSELHEQHWPPGSPRNIDVAEETLLDRLDATVLAHPDKACMVFYDTILSYREFKQESDAVAGWLQGEAGLKPGARVGLYMQNCPQFAMAFYAVIRAGGVVVPINPMSRASELAHYAMDAGIQVVIAADELLPHVSGLLDSGALQSVLAVHYADWLKRPTELPLPDILRSARADLDAGPVRAWSAVVAQALPVSVVAVSPDDLCVMPYTSGTTGSPKGCMHTHRSVLFTAEAGMRWMQVAPDDVVMAAIPMFHVSGMQRGMNGPLVSGNTVVVMTRWDARCAAQLIETYRVTTWTGVPTMFIDLLGNADFDRFDLSSLKRISGGGSAMPAAIAQRIDERLRIPYVEGYGLSETIAPTHINPPHRPKKQCLGIPIFNTHSRIVSPTDLRELPAGEVGEIVIAGPQIFQGYWNNPGATEEAFMALGGETYFRTGDLGYVDEEGYFFMVDRLKRMINASGFKVWPAEVEALFYRNPAVKEICIVSYPDEHRGESVKALVVLAGGHAASAQDLIDWARSQMAAYKVPRRIDFVPSLPKSETGKILWRELQQRAHQG